MPMLRIYAEIKASCQKIQKQTEGRGEGGRNYQCHVRVSAKSTGRKNQAVDPPDTEAVRKDARAAKFISNGPADTVPVAASG